MEKQRSIVTLVAGHLNKQFLTNGYDSVLKTYKSQ